MKKKVLFLLMANVVIIVMIAFGLNIFFNKDSNGFEINDAEGSLWLESVGNDLVGKSSSLTNSDGIDLVIPEGTTEIARNAYKDRTDIKSVTIPNSVTSIGWYAFQGCTNLTSIIIPSSVTSIGSGAFIECTSLVDVTISDGVEEISTQVFMGCTSLESIKFPSSVTSIGVDALKECTSLKSIEVAEDNSNYKSIDGNLYNKKVTQLKQYAIGKSDTTFSIPSGVTSISLFAFLGCTNLTNITIPNTVTNINNCAFEGCTNLTNIIIPDSVTLIEAGAFANCTSLTKIVIPKSVTSLGSGAFRDCTNIKKILIRNGKMYMDSNSFAQITGAKIFVEANEDAVTWDISCSGWDNGNEVYYIGEWIETSFYDQNGKLVFTDCFTTTDTIPTQTASDYTEGCYTYTFIGWDIDDDGIVDTLPETSTDNITAKAVYSKSLTNVTHHDKVNPTCTTKGNIEYWTCETCGKNYLDKDGTTEVTNTTIDELKHNYVFDRIEWTNFTAKAIYVCSNDSNHTVSHDCEITSEVINKATCVATGIMRYTATYSGHTDTIDETLAIDPNNHNLTHHEKVNETCTTKGNIEYWSCSLCNKNYSDKETTTEVSSITINELNHNYVFNRIEWNDITAKAIYVCSNDSNHTESHDCEVISEVINKATCSSIGTRRYTATYSGHTDTIDETLAIDPNNHNLTHHDGLDATCTAKGSIEYYSCSLCNKNYSDKECTTEVTDITIDALGHNYSTVWSSDKDHHFHECSRCHIRSEEESHIWDSGVVTKEATTKEEGKKTYTCKTCNETKEETIPVKSGGCKIKVISFSSVILCLIALVAVLVKKKGWLKKFIK